jgi:hypothetical protein
MAQEFTIKSETIETKINQLLPSQGGFGAGVDFSASTMVVPIVDLTETAEGSGLRQDLQTSISHDKANEFNVSNTTTTVINTTGYYRIIGTSTLLVSSTVSVTNSILLSDGTTDKTVWSHIHRNFSGTINSSLNIDFNVFLNTGDSLKFFSNSTSARIVGSVRQIADISGNLVNP